MLFSPYQPIAPRTSLSLAFRSRAELTRRFVAGETLEEATVVIKRINADGMLGVFDYLGEAVTTAEEALHARDEYLRLLEVIEKHKLNAYASLKPTQMGLVIDRALAYENIREIVLRAREIGTTVRVEMEESTHTQATLDLFKRLRAEFTNVGTVIQSSLYRSEQDMQDLYALGARVRLVKGAYKEPATVAFQAKKDTDANYLKLAEIYLRDPNSPAGAHLALATHDKKIIDWAKKFITEHKVAHTRFEFQMLYGIRSDLQRQLSCTGLPDAVYVPYGGHWYPYFMRRLAERPANVIFLISNLFK